MKTRGTKIVIVFAICISMIVTNMLLFADEKLPGTEPTPPVAENLLAPDEATAIGAEASLQDLGSSGTNGNTDSESLENVAKPTLHCYIADYLWKIYTMIEPEITSPIPR